MKFRTRLKSALRAFKNPGIIERPVQEKIVFKEPIVIIDNQLLAGKNVLITGAGRNIGRSIALEMAKQGANIYFTDIVQSACSNLEKELSEYPVRSKGFLSDVSKSEDSDLLIKYLVDNEINIDILVNNVGIRFETTTIKELEAEWEKVYAHNVFGPMYLTKLISQMMMSNNIPGSIIFITSRRCTVSTFTRCYIPRRLKL